MTSSKDTNHGGRRYMPYVFTKQGIAMLSAILRSDVAIQVSIKIMDSFVKMRKVLVSNQELFSRLDRLEFKQLEIDKKIEEIFNCIATNTEIKQHIFFDGQIYDAFSFIVDIIKKAKYKIILCKKNNNVDVIIVTSGNGNLTFKDINKFNLQYPKLSLKLATNFHDRFLILDDIDVYHIGASIKDAGKKSFGITKIEDKTIIKSLLNKII